MVVVLALAIGASTMWGGCGYYFYKDCDGPAVVTVKEFNEWMLYIYLRGDLTDVVVTDVIPAELDVLEASADCGTVSVEVMGSSDKGSTLITWTIDETSQCVLCTLTIRVATRLSPSCKFFRFTDPGCYWLNLGAHLEGLLFSGAPWSDDTNGIWVTAVP
jgi:hypothetical protein